MKEGLKPYRSPIAIAILAALALSAWAWQGWRDIDEHEKERQRQFTLGTVNSIAEIIRSIGLQDEVARGRVKDILTGMVGRTPVRFAVVELQGKRLIEVGRPPDSLALTSASGETRRDGMLIVWRSTDLAPEGGAGAAGGGREVAPRAILAIGMESPDAMLPGGPAGIVGVGPLPGGPGAAATEAPPGGFRGPRPVQGLLLSVAVALLLLAVSLAAWVMAIRGRLLVEQLKAERSRRQYLEELGLAAAGLAHETKNPLGIILGLAQQIARNPNEPAESLAMVDHIIDEVDRAAARLGNFMTYARQRAAKPVATSVDELYAKVATVLQGDFNAAGVVLRVDCPELCVLADEEMLEQMLVNLLLNSLHASQPKGIVTLQAQRRGDNAVLSVEDQGHGITADLLPDVYKPYVAGSGEGHGLGLAIVKRLVDQHGWNIDIRSQVGHGTTVTVSGVAVAGTETPRHE